MLTISHLGQDIDTSVCLPILPGNYMIILLVVFFHKWVRHIHIENYDAANGGF